MCRYDFSAERQAALGTGNSETKRARRARRLKETAKSDMAPRERVALRKLTSRNRCGLITKNERARMKKLLARERRSVESHFSRAESTSLSDSGGNIPPMPTDEQVKGAVEMLERVSRSKNRTAGEHQEEGGKADDGSGSQDPSDGYEVTFGDWGDSNDSKEAGEGDGDADFDGGGSCGHEAEEAQRRTTNTRDDETRLTRTLVVSNYADSPAVLQVTACATQLTFAGRCVSSRAWRFRLHLFSSSFTAMGHHRCLVKYDGRFSSRPSEACMLHCTDVLDHTIFVFKFVEEFTVAFPRGMKTPSSEMYRKCE